MISLSIIIPYYNRKELLIECLNSIAESDYPQENYEVIVVDDCSPNGIGEILSYSKIKNYRVYRLSVNSGGASIPRNLGISQARGEYVLFIDSDDCISAGMLSRSMGIATRNDCDMVIIKKISERKAANGYKAIVEDLEKIEINSNDILPNIESFVFGDCYAIGRLMRRDVIDRFGIRFPENLKVNEDLCFCRFFWCVAKTAGICASESYWLRAAGSDGLSLHGMPREAAYNLLGYIFRNILTKPTEFISPEKKIRIFNGRIGQNYVLRLLDHPHYASLMKSNHEKYFLAMKDSPDLSAQGREFIERLLYQ
ncbi:glycosyltransferase family 2 protein [Phyllobacterium phragmitis]|uniref:glycosyltransferase family 2 protein n=1 Tax=Phyllobacterium phragmitis TaxID=2670329 RepID=UPI0013050139|nr:glycosyltransferase family 2 protein [Phyllobacterium phragmitis]